MLPQDMDAILPSIASGLTLHLAFNKLEKTHLKILHHLLALFPLLPAYFLWQNYSYKALFIAYPICYATLAASTLAYRLLPLHPLYNYPGPILAKCSKWWGVYQTHTGKTHITILNLHRKYGPVVRIGPNELSITDVDAVQPVLGVDGLPKGPIWDGRSAPGSEKYTSVIGIRNTAAHLQRRKYWNKGLNTTSIKEYQPTLKRRVDQLVDLLKPKAMETRPVDLAQLLSCFAYDFMGDMAFGGGFELMRDGDVGGIWKIMENGIRIQAYSQHLPWAAPILLKGSSVSKVSDKLLHFAIAQSKKRTEQGSPPGRRDLSSHLLGEASNTFKPLQFGDFCSEAFLVIIAGSDTTATVLSSVFYHLIQQRNIYDRLKAEVEEYYPHSEGVRPTDNMSKLAEMLLLNAVINEALRLCPPLPTWLQRSTDTTGGGKLIGSIPDADSFNPDRWIKSDASYVTNQAAFVPYSVGPMNYAGKLLAQLELRVVVASLVRELDFTFKEGWDNDSWESELEDMFFFKKGNLPVVLSHRKYPDSN